MSGLGTYYTDNSDTAEDPVQEELPQTQEEQNQDDIYFAEIYNNLVDKGKPIYSTEKLFDRYLAKAFEGMDPEKLVWPFGYYLQSLSENMEPPIYIDTKIHAAIHGLSYGSVYEKEIYQHKIYKNLLYNVKNVSFMQENGSYKILEYSDLESLFQQENKFILAKIDMSENLIGSLKELGLDNELGSNFVGIANPKHDVAYKYFVLSSESLTFAEYLNLLPQDRWSEPRYYNSFDDMDLELPEFSTNESDLGFTYLKSNYVPQSSNANMSLKGIGENFSETETTESTGLVSISTTENTTDTNSNIGSNNQSSAPSISLPTTSGPSSTGGY